MKYRIWRSWRGNCTSIEKVLPSKLGKNENLKNSMQKRTIVTYLLQLPTNLLSSFHLLQRNALQKIEVKNFRAILLKIVRLSLVIDFSYLIKYCRYFLSWGTGFDIIYNCNEKLLCILLIYCDETFFFYIHMFDLVLSTMNWNRMLFQIRISRDKTDPKKKNHILLIRRSC